MDRFATTLIGKYPKLDKGKLNKIREGGLFNR
jgi:hypothetical protein